MLSTRKLFFLLLFVIVYFTGFSQDILVKKDSSRIEVIILEITRSQIKYKRFSNEKGPTYIEEKVDCARIEYKNGTKDLLKNDPDKKVNPTIGNDQSKVSNGKFKARLSNWLQFNIEIGACGSQNYTMVPPNDEPYLKYFNYETYSKNSYSNKINCSPYVATNLIIGRNKRLHHLIGFSYCNLKTNYNYYAELGNSSPGLSVAKYTVSSWTVKGDYYFINFNSGLDIRLYKKLHFTVLASANFKAKSTLIKNGSDVETIRTLVSGTGNATVYSYSYDSTLYYNSVQNDDENNVLLSYQAKFHYDLNAKSGAFSIFLLGNIGSDLQMTYASLGLGLYPFKKLRPKPLKE